MTGILTRRLAGLAACATLALAAAAPADDRKPEEILADIEAVEQPKLDQSRIEDRDYVQEYIRQREDATARRADLIGELYRVAPDHPQLSELMPQRWSDLMASPFTMEELRNELTAIVADEESPFRIEAAYFKAMLAVRIVNSDVQETLDAIESFIAMAPEDDRGGILLYQVAENNRGLSADRKQELLARLLDDYPNSPAAERARGSMRQSEAVGKPFELTFNDAISGRTISVQDDLKGKVVVVDFWATWCGPCVAEMPTMKQLYAEYKDKGVEFIGVSLDAPEADGGLETLKAFVEENEITWPQYYQGNAWDSEFSRSWGINAIPAVFIVDTQGKLHSTEARGQLETLIPELLAKTSPAGEE